MPTGPKGEKRPADVNARVLMHADTRRCSESTAAIRVALTVDAVARTPLTRPMHASPPALVDNA